MRSLLIAGGIAFVCGSVTACKSEAPKQVAAAVPTPSKTTDEPSKEIPPDLFKSMPIYPGATVEDVRKPKGAMREIVFQTPGQFNEVVGFYKDELKKNEFHITSSLIMPARRTWSCDFHKGGRPATIMLYPADVDKSKLVIDLIYEIPATVDQSMQEEEETFDVIGPGDVAQQAPNSKEKAERN
ncbi:MAG: hypothetical protein ACLQAT_26275 [Candidatus Binataceae bacterium]